MAKQQCCCFFVTALTHPLLTEVRWQDGNNTFPSWKLENWLWWDMKLAGASLVFGCFCCCCCYCCHAVLKLNFFFKFKWIHVFFFFNGANNNWKCFFHRAPKFELPFYSFDVVLPFFAVVPPVLFCCRVEGDALSVEETEKLWLKCVKSGEELAHG